MRTKPRPPRDTATVVDRPLRHHLIAGWLGLLAFLSLGIVLEALHAWKAPFYLDTGQSHRRLMWTLAHAHGTLLSLVQIVLANSVRSYPFLLRQGCSLVKWGLLGGQVLIPAGFFAGGLWMIGGEPGLGVFLIPPGAALLLLGVGLVTWNAAAGCTGK